MRQSRRDFCKSILVLEKTSAVRQVESVPGSFVYANHQTHCILSSCVFKSWFTCEKKSNERGKCSNAPAKKVKNAQKSLIDREKKTLRSQASLLGKPGALIVFLRGVEASPAS